MKLALIILKYHYNWSELKCMESNEWYPVYKYDVIFLFFLIE